MMTADEISNWLSVLAQAAGGLWAVARFVLLVLDRLDDRWPKLHVLTDLMGTFLGGSKPRYDD